MGLLDKFKKDKDVKTDDILKIRKLYEEGKYEEQLVLIDKAYQDKTEAYYYTRGNCLYALSRFDDALKSYQMAIKLDRKYVKAHYRIAQIMFVHQRYAEAEEIFEDMIRIEGENNLFEWSNAATFYIALCRNFQYQESKDPVKLEARDKAVNYLQDHFDFKNEDKAILEFFEENYQDILDGLEPNVLVDLRTGKKGKSSGIKIVVKDNEYKKEDYGLD